MRVNSPHAKCSIFHFRTLITPTKITLINHVLPSYMFSCSWPHHPQDAYFTQGNRNKHKKSAIEKREEIEICDKKGKRTK